MNQEPGLGPKKWKREKLYHSGKPNGTCSREGNVEVMLLPFAPCKYGERVGLGVEDVFIKREDGFV
jgi:hypothetical protein